MNALQKAGKDTIKKNNKRVILNALMGGDMSRVDLIRLTGLSRSTVSSLVAELIREKLVYEKEHAVSSCGRKPVILSIDRDYSYTLLIQIDLGCITAAVVDLKLEIVYEREYRRDLTGESAVADALYECAAEAARENRDRMDRIASIGVSITGIIDHATGRIIRSTLLQLRDFDIRAALRRCFSQPVRVFRDTDAILMGECRLQRLKAEQGYLFVLVDNGIGFSFMNDGKLLRLGRSGFEIGSLPIDFIGHSGGEAGEKVFISLSSLVRQYREFAQQQGILSAREAGYLDMVRLAQSGDAVCKRMIDNHTRSLGLIISVAVNIFAPDQVIIGGQVSLANREMKEKLRENILCNVLDVYCDVKIRYTQNVQKSALIGMADQLFSEKLFG